MVGPEGVLDALLLSGALDVVDVAGLRRDVYRAVRASAMKADIEASLRAEDRRKEEEELKALGLSPPPAGPGGASAGQGRSPAREARITRTKNGDGDERAT